MNEREELERLREWERLQELEAKAAGAPPAEQQQQSPQDPGFGKQALAVLGEYAAASNRSLADFIDFIGPGTANAMLRLAGIDYQLPTVRGSLQATGIEGGFMQPGTARGVVRAAGSTTPVAAGLMPVARTAGTASSNLMDFIGIGSTKVPERVAETTARELALKRRSGQAPAAGYRLEGPMPQRPEAPPYNPPQKGGLPATPEQLAGQQAETAAEAGVNYPLGPNTRVVPDPAQLSAIENGVKEGVVSMVHAGNPETRSAMRKMLDIVKRSRIDEEYKALNRPSKVIGQVLNDRLGIIMDANRKAGQDINRIAKGLKNEYVDVTDPIRQFTDDLAEHDIYFDPATKTVDFSNSTIEGLDAAQGIIKRMLNRLVNTKPPNAYDVHRVKRFIDEQVTYGKTQAGLSGQMVGILKKLRRNLDQALDSQFPDYDRANQAYADTIKIIDDIQGMAGSRVDLNADNADRALGVMSRKILSNYATGTPMLNTFNDLQDVAGKYLPLSGRQGGKLNENIVQLASFDGELRRLFPEEAIARNTFEMESPGANAIAIGRDALTGNKPGLIMQGLKAATKPFAKSPKQVEREAFKRRVQSLDEILKD